MSEVPMPKTLTGDEWVIEPRGEGVRAIARDVWQYRRLLRFFALRSFQKLYRRTVLGVAWLFIRPLFPLLVSTLVFGGVLGVAPGGQVPYFLFLAVGTSVWEFFASSLMWGTRSLELNRGMLSRIYIPRLILPIAMVAPALMTFVIHLGVIIVAFVYYRWTRGIWFFHPLQVGWAVQGFALAWLLSLGIALWTSVPALIARDVRFTLNYVLGFWLFLTPVVYSLDSVPAKYRWAFTLNPMTASVESFKIGLINLGSIDSRQLLTAWGVALFTLISGLLFFSRAERNAADKS
ncbi:MAG TPA: ABC transporter permease [Vicinamibacterales bacterium]|nr:ABC transporter permease [Vicinamibacterales bacterium]